MHDRLFKITCDIRLHYTASKQNVLVSSKKWSLLALLTMLKITPTPSHQSCGE